ncbi:RadC family protein [Eisenibacter elegans]|uniref:RadC family protein n=1 Tax=Eisenibacter elegans TaxID=997 RepID=UPI00042A8ADC|nr:DNA repair protein RadC [Eisenibacter elegans]
MEEQNPKYLAINHWAADDRPREKLRDKGREALSDAELIAILIGSGTVSMSAVELAKQILQATNNDLHHLAQLNMKDLQKFKGIGEAKAITIMAALELGRRRKAAEPHKRPRISSSADVYNLMQAELLDLPYEQFWIILLNNANVVIQKTRISSGGVSGTVVDAKMVFQPALQALATGIILVHNHPSGNLKPSQADKTLTHKLKEGGKVLDIQILDHLIFTNNGYLSFADEGIL